MSPHSKANPLALDLVEVIGKEKRSHYGHDKNAKSHARQNSLKSQRSPRSNRSHVSRRQSHRKKASNETQVNHGGQHLSNKLRPSTTNFDSQEVDLGEGDLKEWRKYDDPTKEKYEVNERALNCFQRQFSIKGTVCDRVTAFKLGISGQAGKDIQNQRRGTQQIRPGGIKIKAL